jgi:tetratricopeptide (TPR) repeat protein
MQLSQYLLLSLMGFYALSAPAANMNTGGLPSYCSNSAQRSSLQPVAGFPIHHYCYALQHINGFYIAKNADDKRRLLNLAASEFKYVISHSSPKSDLGLLSEVYVSRGLMHTMGKDMHKAQLDYSKALELNPKQARAYAELAGYYEIKKLPAKALEIVAQGLRYIPDDSMLQKKYRRLGGAMPFPLPLENPPESKERPATSVEDNKTQTAEQALVENKSDGSVEEKQPVTPGTEAGGSSNNKTNPWCRFCP